MIASTESLRVANSAHESADPFRALKEVPFVHYEEDSLAANAVGLHQGRVDVALIPLVEFAAHGGYSGLDFGIACSRPSSQLFLYGNGPLHQLQTIYMHPDCVTGAVLLRLLVAEHWRITPRLVRMHETIQPQSLKPNEGVLVLAAPDREIDVEDLVCMDLVAEWESWTGWPMVFNIWAIRPEVMDRAQVREVTFALHRCNQAYQCCATESLPEGAGDAPASFIYYFDEDVKQGIQFFLDRAAAQGLVPATEYRSCTVPISEEVGSMRLPTFSIERTIEDVLAGKRLSLHDAERLSELATLADMGLAADTLRQRLYSQPSLRKIAQVDIAKPGDARPIANCPGTLDLEEVTQIQLVTDSVGKILPINEYECILQELRGRTSCIIEGFSAASILAIAENEQLRVRQVVSRLISAGLDLVPANGGEYLVSTVPEPPASPHRITPANWLRVMLWVHRFGGRTAATIDIQRTESWRDVVNHLHVIRQMQDLTSGFAYFCLAEPDAEAQHFEFESRLRIIALARLFLDNIPAIHTSGLAAIGCCSYLAQSFGANALHILEDSKALNQGAQLESVFRQTCS